MPTIRPSSELRNNYAGIMKQCRETQEPIFLTVNGKGDSVIMPIEEYEREQRIKKLNLMLEEAEEDSKAGRIVSHEEVFDTLTKLLLASKDKQADSE